MRHWNSHTVRALTAAALALSLCLGARAAAPPEEIRYETADGVATAVYTATIAPGEDPQSLVQPDFTHGGYRYTLDHLDTEPITETDTREGSRLVQVETDTPEYSVIRAQLQDTLDQTEDGYTGVLTLDESSIETVPEEVRAVKTPLSAVRTYPGLPSNDSAALPKAIQESGNTLTLAQVSWQVEASQVISGRTFPVRWTATATYTGSAVVQQAAGYRTSAVYRGTLTREVLTGIRVTVTYTGTPIPAATPEPTAPPTTVPTVAPTAVLTQSPAAAPTAPADPAETHAGSVLEPDPEEPAPSGMPLPARIGCIALVLAVLVSAGAVLHQVFRFNLKIYRQINGKDRYILAGRYRVSESNPVVRLREHIPQGGTLVAALDEDMAKKLQGKEISLIAEDRLAVHTVGNVRGTYWFRANFGPGRDSV